MARRLGDILLHRGWIDAPALDRRSKTKKAAAAGSARCCWAGG